MAFRTRNRIGNLSNIESGFIASGQQLYTTKSLSKSTDRNFDEDKIRESSKHWWSARPRLEEQRQCTSFPRQYYRETYIIQDGTLDYNGGKAKLGIRAHI